jgi:hypothetical protein
MAAPRTQYAQRRGSSPGRGSPFEERGEHQLKGVPDLWTLYAVTG